MLNKMSLSLLKTAFVRESGGKYYVYSHKGKALSKGYASKEEANKRLGQIEYFKHKNAEYQEPSGTGVLAETSNPLVHMFDKFMQPTKWTSPSLLKQTPAFGKGSDVASILSTFK
jgi:hypothetical protein